MWKLQEKEIKALNVFEIMNFFDSDLAQRIRNAETVEKEKCFWTVGDSFERNEWLDFGELNSTNSNYPNSDGE